MNDITSALERLEARLDYQTTRIDALYALLVEGSILHHPSHRGDDELFDELIQIEDAPLARGTHASPERNPSEPLHVGDATGV